MHGDDVGACDATHPEFAKDGQQVQPQHDFVSAPTTLFCFCIGHVTGMHEFSKRGDVFETTLFYFWVAAVSEHLLHLMRLGPRILQIDFT